MIRIKDWSKYQSYKDRRPPWIRFHRTILDDYTFQSMSADGRALLPMLWLLACEDEDPTSGLIKASEEEIVFRLRMTKKTLSAALMELQGVGFVACINSVTDHIRNRNQTVPPETEAETETETETKIIFNFGEWYNLYPIKKGREKAIKSYHRVIKNKAVTHKELMEGLQRNLEDIKQNKTEKKFIKHPATWLNQGCWADEYDSPQKAGPLF